MLPFTMRRDVAFALLALMAIFAIKAGLQAFRLKHSKIAHSVAAQAAAERGEFPEPPPEIEKAMKQMDGMDSGRGQHRYTVSFAARPCPADPNHVHNLAGDVRPEDIPYTGLYEILTESGKKRAEGTAPADGGPMPLDNMPPGRYLLRVNVPGTTVTVPLNIYEGSSHHLRVVVPQNCTMRGIR